MNELLADAENEVLVGIVRATQKKGLKGAKGGWKEFLNYHDPKYGDALSDPARRTTNDLVSFLKTFNEEDNSDFISKILRLRRDHKAMEEFIKGFPDKETPQQKLVRLTMKHPNYMEHYSLPSDEKEWIVAPLGKVSKAMKSKRMVSVDCEMVLCQDGTEAVVKVSVVDRKLKVKLNKFVNPNKTVIDYRTEITGVSAGDLDGVTYSLTDVQNFLKELLSHGYILVGHSLHNDLRALKIDYPRIIDTAYIFTFSDLPPTYAPSLNNLCKSVLGSEVRKAGESHNCLDDAQATMKLVLAKLEHGFNDPISIESKAVSTSDLAKLLLHKIRSGTPLEELRRIFPSGFDVDIQTDIRVKGQTYSTFAVFKDASEADEAFRGIEGQQSQDSSGKLQKRVLLRLNTGERISFFVRRMTIGDLVDSDDLLKKRPTPEETNHALVNDDALSSKKRPAPKEAENEIEDPKRQCLQPCDHVKEVKKLRKELRKREEEISNMQKILSALTRKHGL